MPGVPASVRSIETPFLLRARLRGCPKLVAFLGRGSNNVRSAGLLHLLLMTRCPRHAPPRRLFLALARRPARWPLALTPGAYSQVAARFARNDAAVSLGALLARRTSAECSLIFAAGTPARLSYTRSRIPSCKALRACCSLHAFPQGTSDRSMGCRRCAAPLETSRVLLRLPTHDVIAGTPLVFSPHYHHLHPHGQRFNKAYRLGGTEGVAITADTHGAVG